MSLTTPVPLCARADIQATVAGRPVECSIWCKKISGIPTDGDVNALAFRVAVLASIGKGAFSNDYTFRQVTAFNYHAGPGLPQIRTFVPGPGLVASPSRAASIALSLWNHTSPERTSHYSVNYLAGVPDSMVTGNMIDTAWADGRALDWSNYIVNLPIFGWRFVAVRRVVNGVALTNPIVENVTAVTVRSYEVRNRRMRLNTR